MHDLDPLRSNSRFLNEICRKLADGQYPVSFLQSGEKCFTTTLSHCNQYFVAMRLDNKRKLNPLVQPKPQEAITHSCKLDCLGSFPKHNLGDGRTQAQCTQIILSHAPCPVIDPRPRAAVKSDITNISACKAAYSVS